MTFFVAVIFWCYGDVCSFAYSSNMYSTKQTCIESLDAEMKRMGKIEPTMTMNGVCLQMKDSRT